MLCDSRPDVLSLGLCNVVELQGWSDLRAYYVPLDRELTARASGRRSVLRGALVTYPLLLLVLSFVNIVAPQRAGWLAVTQIFAPILFLPLLVLVPVSLARGMLGLRVVALLCVGVFVLRYMPPVNVIVRTPNTAAAQISVLTWNVYEGNSRYDLVNQVLQSKPADVVFLQEADASKIDPEALVTSYPYELAEPDGAPPGMVLLSDYPIITHGELDGDRDLWDIPRLMWAKLDLGEGRVVTVVGAHPMSAYTIGDGCSLPICYSPAWRDRQIEAMRDAFISPTLDSGDPLIVAGDFNITEREPAYADLSRGLTDAWKSVGTGFGTTWRPGFMMGQQLGLLRIDYLFAGPTVRPLGISVDCTPHGSDHCRVMGRFEVGQ
jgi:endonuclease/exonuclease/phosphatase (EEP) superfamily protein YafD